MNIVEMLAALAQEGLDLIADNEEFLEELDP